MLIRLGYDIAFDTPRNVPIVTLLNVHPSRMGIYGNRTRIVGGPATPDTIIPEWAVC